MSVVREAPTLDLCAAYRRVRAFTDALCEGLAPEDCVVQSMPDVSPTKWHLAHTSWFFETFLLSPHLPDYRSPNPQYHFLFNSYYVQAGERHCRDQRGYLSRPTVREVMAYRAHVDRGMNELLASGPDEDVTALVTLGLHHEQQHQELILTDIKHVFSVNPLRPVYRAQDAARTKSPAVPMSWIRFDEGIRQVGQAGPGFSFDNERPRHRQFLETFELASRPVTNGEYLEFMDAGGYRRPELWLSAGWDAVQRHRWTEPFYWERHDRQWCAFTLHGTQPLQEDEPVCHVSYFEADAFARWRGARLPTEFEWEVAAQTVPVVGNFVEANVLHPAPAGLGLAQMFGDMWEWTRSPYAPYPGFQAAPGAVGEYNGKWMCNQFVLRGGSCVTSVTHIRPTYRNFFPPDATWQFTGIRLARDSA
jgi:ergothioneine biosynthesis protein EgtB